MEIGYYPGLERKFQRVLFEHGQYRSSKHNMLDLICDEDDVHEYLCEAGLIDEDDWLSDEVIKRVFTPIYVEIF